MDNKIELKTTIKPHERGDVQDIQISVNGHNVFHVTGFDCFSHFPELIQFSEWVEDLAKKQEDYENQKKAANG